MAIIKVDNTFSIIEDASPVAIREIDAELAVETPGCHYNPLFQTGNWDGKTRFLKRGKKSIKFPTGLLHTVLSVMEECGERVTLQEHKYLGKEPVIPDEIQLLHKELGHITLRDYQYEAVVKGITNKRGVINVATNGGKTEIACGIIKCLLDSLQDGQKIVFFTHAKEIFSQSHKRIEERLGIKVGKIGDGKWDEQQVTVVMIPTIARNLKSKDKEKKERTTQFLESIVAFLGDEVHHASSDTWYQVFMSLSNAEYRFGLTGTVDKSNRVNEMKLYGCTGHIIHKVSNKFLIENGYSAKPTIHMIRLDGIHGLDCRFYPDVRRLGIIENTVRNTAFVNKVVERANSGKQCLVIVNETEHGDIVLEMLKKTGVSVEFSHGKRTSKFREEVLESLRSGELQVLIATSILDEGVDVSGINCVFLMAGGKSMRQLLQRIGRGLRKKADGGGLEVYDSLDYHHNILTEHLLDRYNTYKQEGFEIKKI